MAHRKIIILHGMMTSENFGDMLLSQVMIKWIRSFCDCDIRAASASADVAQKLGIRKATIGDIIRSRATIMSGGGYFQPMDRGATILKTFFGRSTRPLLLAMAMRKPFAIIGVGLGALPHESMRKTLRLLIDTSVVTSLRDSRSLNHAEALKLRSLPKKTGDFAFTLTIDDIPNVNRAAASQFRAELDTPRAVGIHLSGTSEDEGYATIYKALHHTLSDRTDVGIYLIEDHPSQFQSPQKKAQQELQAMFGIRRTRIVPYKDTATLCAQLSTLDAVLTNKLHVGLAAAAMGTEPYCIAKNDKNNSSFSEMHLQDNCRMIGSAEMEIWNLVERFSRHTAPYVLPAELRESSAANAQLLRAFLVQIGIIEETP